MSDKARVGVNLGFSPQHAKSVFLILSLKTGLIPPKFHCKYDDLFETGINAKQQPESLWQEKDYLTLPNHDLRHLT